MQIGREFAWEIFGKPNNVTIGYVSILVCNLFSNWQLYQGRLRPKISHVQIFLNLPRKKVMINYCQKGKKKKIGGQQLRFGENMSRKIPLI